MYIFISFLPFRVILISNKFKLTWEVIIISLPPSLVASVWKILILHFGVNPGFLISSYKSNLQNCGLYNIPLLIINITIDILNWWHHSLTLRCCLQDITVYYPLLKNWLSVKIWNLLIWKRDYYMNRYNSTWEKFSFI